MNQLEKCLLTAFVNLTFASMSLAQQSVGIGPGVRVRVTTATGHANVTGSLLTLDENTITVVDDGQPIKVPRALVTQLEVSMGRTQRHVLAGLLIGAAGGAIVGATHSPCVDTEPCQTTQGQFVAMSVAATAAGGAVIGYLWKSERWVGMPLDRVRVSVQPGFSGGGLGVLLTVRF